MHSFSQRLKNISGNILSLLGDDLYPSAELLVVNYHGTPKKFIPEFMKQLEYLNRMFTVIGPQDLLNYYSGKRIESNKPLLLLTFDDGIKNNLRAADVLEKRNQKAFYFVIPGFIEAAPGEQKSFFRANIRPSFNEKLFDAEDDLIPMSWSDLSSLSSSGNSIGSHTYTHTLVAGSSSEENSTREIAGSKEIIERKINRMADSFCSINNTLLSVGKKEMQIIRENYQFHFTTIPGSNFSGKDRYFIRRVNIETHWLPGALKYALGKTDRLRWARKERLFRAISDDKRP